jgi:hypothetical protein
LFWTITSCIQRNALHSENESHIIIAIT